MKLPVLTPFTMLNCRGIAHFVAPLAIVLIVALTGTYLLVASHAAPLSKQPTGSTGVLLLYSNGGLYKRAVVSAFGDNHPQCATKNKALIFTLPTPTLPSRATVTLTGPLTRVTCSASNYNVYFLKKSDSASKISPLMPSTYASVGLSANYCAFVHIARESKVQSIQNGHCVGDNDPSNVDIVKRTPTISLVTKPDPIVLGKAYTATIFVRVPGDDTLSPEECAGSVIQHAEIANAGARQAVKIKSFNIELPLRYNRSAKACIFQDKESSKDTTDTATTTFQPADLRGTITFSGNKFLNPASGPFTYKQVKK